MKIEFYDCSPYYDDYSGFSLVGKNNQELFEPDPCKEGFCNNYWDFVHRAHDKKKVILFKASILNEKGAKQAQNLLNIFEKMMRTSRSKVSYQCDLGTIPDSKSHRFVIEVTSPLWFKNGPMLHLFCLLVRNAYLITRQTTLKTIFTKLRTGSDCNQFITSKATILSLIANRGILIASDDVHQLVGICDFANGDYGGGNY